MLKLLNLVVLSCFTRNGWNKYYFDSGLFENLPFKTDLKYFDKVITISTREKGFRQKGVDKFQMLYNIRYSNNKILLDKLTNFNSNYNKEFDELVKLTLENKMFTINYLIRLR